MTPGMNARIGALRSAVLVALDRAGVSGIDILSSSFVYAPIQWTAPGIIPWTNIDGIPTSLFSMHGALAYQGSLHESQELYDQIIRDLKYLPGRAMSEDRSYVKTAADLFGIEPGAARLVFSGAVVEDDGNLVEEAGYTFALEYAVAAAWAGMGELVHSADDCYVRGPGLLAGVKDGMVLRHEEIWPTNISGYAESFLTMTRGAGWYTETADVYDRCIYWFESLTDIHEELEGFREAITVLKATSYDADARRFETNLLNLRNPLSKKAPAPETHGTGRRRDIVDYHRRLEEAQAVMAAWTQTDQIRVMQLLELLVPYVITENVFNSRIHPLDQRVTILSPRQVARINKFLETLRNKRTPNANKTV